MNLEDYLNQHFIVRNEITSPGYVCNEIIVDDPKEFVSVVRENGCYISAILWWDRADRTLGSRIGCGGLPDPRNPHDYYFAETYLYKEFDTILEDAEYYAYFDQIKKEYPDLDLFPGFDIKPLPQI